MSSNVCGDAFTESSSCKVPAVKSRSMGMLCFILNIFLPGCGTILAGFLSDQPSTMIVGVSQFILSWFIIGWIWSVVWGYLIWTSAEGQQQFQSIGAGEEQSGKV